MQDSMQLAVLAECAALSPQAPTRPTSVTYTFRLDEETFNERYMDIHDVKQVPEAAWIDFTASWEKAGNGFDREVGEAIEVAIMSVNKKTADSLPAATTTHSTSQCRVCETEIGAAGPCGSCGEKIECECFNMGCCNNESVCGSRI